MATETIAPVGASTKRRRFGPWLLMVGVVIMLAGLLFGYDQGVIAGALEGIQRSFHVSSTMTEVITSWVTLGALFGALVGVVDVDPELGAVAHHGADQVGEVADRERQVGEAELTQLVDDDGEDRAVADREQRLGQHRRVGAQAGALSSGKDDGPFAHRFSLGTAVPGLER